MMPIAIGINRMQENPADGTIRRVQVQGGPLYIDEVVRARSRTTQPRMSENAFFFAMLEDSEPRSYVRPDRAAIIDIREETTEGGQEEVESQMPVKIAVYQRSTAPEYNTEFFLDNVSLKVSTILFEVSSDDGVTWFPLVSSVNNAVGRFMLPEATGDILVRISGMNPEDWVAGYVLRPIFNVCLVPPISIIG